MILGEPRRWCSSAYSAAAHSTPTWRMPPPSILRKRRARSTSARPPAITDPTGAPSPLEKQARDRIERRGQLALRDPARDGGVPDPRAIEVQREAAPARARHDRRELIARPDAATAAIVRVLDGDQPRVGQVSIVGQRLRSTSSAANVPSAPPISANCTPAHASPAPDS